MRAGRPRARYSRCSPNSRLLHPTPERNRGGLGWRVGSGWWRRFRAERSPSIGLACVPGRVPASQIHTAAPNNAADRMIDTVSETSMIAGIKPAVARESDLLLCTSVSSAVSAVAAIRMSQRRQVRSSGPIAGRIATGPALSLAHFGCFAAMQDEASASRSSSAEPWAFFPAEWP